MGEVEMEVGLPEEGEAVVALEGSDLEAASVVPRFCKIKVTSKRTV